MQTARDFLQDESMIEDDSLKKIYINYYFFSVTPDDLSSLNALSTSSKSKIGVCVKAILYPNSDVSLKFIEWIEYYREQGFAKVHRPHSNFHSLKLKT